MTATKWRAIQIAGILLVILGLVAAWEWTGLRQWTDVDRWTELVEPYRKSWYALFLVVAIFVLLELVMFPVLVLIFLCGVVFGPWIGTAYAMAGAVASAIPPFFIGRWIGRRKLLRLGGPLAKRLSRALKKRGVLAVFIVRKIPAPYTGVNLICGASSLSFWEFLAGTTLGLLTGVVLITVLGTQLFEIFKQPKPGTIAFALGVLALAIGLVFVAQHFLNRHVAKS